LFLLHEIIVELSNSNAVTGKKTRFIYLIIKDYIVKKDQI
jgi:hypothetical protein